MIEVSEIRYLLRFFSQKQGDLWRQVPNALDPVWVRVGEIETATDKPILLLALVLSAHLARYSSCFQDELLDLLEEIRVLLYWIIESPFTYVFSEREETDERVKIWLILRRLCLAALQYEWRDESDTAAISFEYFLERYTSPLDGEDFGTPIH